MVRDETNDLLSFLVSPSFQVLKEVPLLPLILTEISAFDSITRALLIQVQSRFHVAND